MERDRRVKWEISFCCGSLMKIKNRSNDRCIPPRYVGRMISRIDTALQCKKAVRNTGIGGENGKTELVHKFAITRAFYTPWKLTS